MSIKIPLQVNFINYEPLTDDNLNQFIGHTELVERVSDYIVQVGGGRFLITGYSGVGKTSFVNKVIEKTREKLLNKNHREVLQRGFYVIKLDFVNPPDANFILDRLVGRLYYASLQKKFAINRHVQEILNLSFLKTRTETIEEKFGENTQINSSLSSKTLIEVGIGGKKGKTKELLIRHSEYKISATIGDLEDILISASFIKETVFYRMIKRIKEFFHFNEKGRQEPIIIIIFDEIPKWEFIKSLSNLFTIPNVTFMVVSKREVRDEWIRKKESGEEELCNFQDIYLSCLWDGDSIDEICKKLIDENKSITDEQRDTYINFKRFLIYKGRGLPREILKAFDKYVKKDGEQSILQFTDNDLKGMSFFAELQALLENKEKEIFGEYADNVLKEEKDRARRGVYYMINKVLKKSGYEEQEIFTSFDLSVLITPQQKDRVIKNLLNLLVKEKYLRPSGSRRYTLGERITEVLRYIPDLLEHGFIEVTQKVEEREGGQEVQEEEPSTARAEAEETTGIWEPSLFKKEELQTLGELELIEKIGEGGMASVYKAHHKILDVLRVVKVLPARYAHDKEFLRRFEREAKIAARLNHSNIVTIHNIGIERDICYIEMEYIDGNDLRKIKNSQGKIPIPIALFIIIEICKALDHAHQREFTYHNETYHSIIHRDIKPGNIMVTKDGEVKLTDFGIARAVDVLDETITGTLVGTILYMSKEQLDGKSVDHRTDIYSLGVVLYEILTSRNPFGDQSITEVIRRIASGKYPSPCKLDSTIPKKVERIISKAMALEPNDRYQDIREMSYDLQKYLSSFNITNSTQEIQNYLQDKDYYRVSVK